MKRPSLVAFAIAIASISAAGVVLAAQDRSKLKAPNGVSFAEFKGYEKWQMIASSQADDHTGCGAAPDPGCIKSILGNATLVKAFAEGIPASGKPFPDGAAFVKIEWTKVRNSDAPYGVTVPGKLAQLSFMVKSAKRFPTTDGWGYATFKYDDAADTWTAFGDSPDFALTCHKCHTLVKSRDFVFTGFARR